MPTSPVRSFTTQGSRNRPKVAEFEIDGISFDVLEPSGSATLMALNWVAAVKENSRDTDSQRRAVGALADFLGACMSDEQYDELYRILVDPRRGLSFEDVVALAVFVVEEATAFPTRQPTASARGRSSTGTRSRGGSSSRGSTSRKSAARKSSTRRTGP